jgi:large subunit ribosomal protein L24
MVTKNPDKQRKALALAPLNERRRKMASHLSKDLMTKYKKRAVVVRKGDTVKVMRGKFKGLSGKVLDVDYSTYAVFIDVAKGKKVSGKEYKVPIHPSNLLISDLDLGDELRKRSVESKSGK